MDDKKLSKSGAQNWGHNPPPASLCHAIVACLKDAKGALVAHLDQHAQGQLQHHPALVRHKVAHVLQQEVARTVVITEGEVGGHEGVLQDKTEIAYEMKSVKLHSDSKLLIMLQHFS